MNRNRAGNCDGEGHVCPPSVAKWLNCPVRKLLQNPKKIFGRFVRNGDTVVDLGCGGGFFTVALAQMVGENGRVTAVDMQEEMLDITCQSAQKKGVMDRITLHLCKPTDLGLSNLRVDFALAFYVVHEVPDRQRFMRQVAGILKPDAVFLLVEPKHHVKTPEFELIVEDAVSAGLEPIMKVKAALSRGMAFMPGNAE